MIADHFTAIEKFEADLWKLADDLRANSNLASNEYFMPILGLLFLRQASNRYYAALKAIEADKAAGKIPNRPLVEADFTRRRALMLPEKARYDSLLKLEKGADIGAEINLAMEAVEQHFPPLAGQLPKDYARFDNEVLERMLRMFDAEALRTASGDVFGRIYEYFLAEFSKQGAHDNGEFFTPPSIVQTIVNVIEPNHGIIFDPACGTGGMFVQSSHFIEDTGQETMKRATFYGHEKNETSPVAAEPSASVITSNPAIRYHFQNRPTVLINNTPIPKEREMSDENRVEWTKLLEQAISEPGKINEAYSRFHGYSLGNRLWAMCQCVMRGIEPSPLASFNRWKELGRHVKKGERALSLCMPVTRKRSQADRDGNEIEITYQFFVVKKNWFVLSQTEGAEYTPDSIPNWDEQRALSILNISKVPFDLLNGNVQGYAAPDRKISVSPLATSHSKLCLMSLRIRYWVMSNQQARSQTRMRHHAVCRSRLNPLPCCAARRSGYREWSIPEITSSRGPMGNQLVNNQPIACLRQRTKS